MLKRDREFKFEEKVYAIHQLRVNIKSLVAESRIIRAETRRAGVAYKNSLALHRRVRLREEMRYAHLALAFVRGKSYRTIESKPKSPVSGTRLTNKVSKFLCGNMEAKVLDWLAQKSDPAETR